MVPQRTPIPPTPRTTSIKHLSKVEMRERREKGICYKCDEKFTWGHQCVEKNIYPLDVDSTSTPKIYADTQDLVDDEDNI